MEKAALPITNCPRHGVGAESTRVSLTRKLLLWTTLSLVLMRGILIFHPSFGQSVSSTMQSIYPPLLGGYLSGRQTLTTLSGGDLNAICVQEIALEPKNRRDMYKQLGSLFETAKFRQRAVELHSGAIQIPTESYDQMDDIGVDPRWEAFQPFHEYLFKSFPLM